MPRKVWLGVGLLLVLVACQNHTAVPPNNEGLEETSGGASVQNWSDPRTWGGSIPTATTAVVIPAGKTVLLDVSARVKSLHIDGTLRFADRDLQLSANWIMVHGQGLLQIGTEAAPYSKKATITLTATDTNENVMGMGTKFLGTMMGGRIEMQGLPVRSWSKLAADAAVGARQITLSDVTGWRAGDRIVIATSSPNMNHYDVVDIQSVNGNTLNLVQALKYRHFGTVHQVGDVRVDVRAEVGLLSRNIVVQGDANSQSTRFGAHAMFMADVPGQAVKISGVEFRGMGQFNRLGRYPVHFHLMGNNCTGCYLRNSTIRDSIQRGVVLHDSAVTVSNNVLFNTVGHNLVVETPQSVGSVIEGNLALVNRQPNPLFTEATLRTQEDRLPANYWMRSANNQVIGNVAAGSFSSGFIYDGVGAEAMVFRGNVVHAAMGRVALGEGDFDLMAGLLIVSGENRPANDIIEDTLAYHNRIGLWPEESETPIVIRRFTLAENALGVENRGVGNQVLLQDGVFVRSLPGSNQMLQSDALHNQYGSEVVLQNPTFVNYTTIGLAATDTGPTQSSFTLSNGRMVGGKAKFSLTDLSTTTFADDSLLPKGTYVYATAPWLTTSACTNASAHPSTLEMLRCPVRYPYTELDVRNGANLSARINPFLLRSDGLRYRRAGGDEGLGSGMHGTTVLYNAGLSYALETALAKGYAVRLSSEAIPDAAVDREQVWVDVVVPVNAAPSAVHRTGSNFDKPNPPSNASRLRAASSLTDWNANPLSSYFYDAAAKKVWVKASVRWVIVLP